MPACTLACRASWGRLVLAAAVLLLAAPQAKASQTLADRVWAYLGDSGSSSTTDRKTSDMLSELQQRTLGTTPQVTPGQQAENEILLTYARFSRLSGTYQHKAAPAMISAPQSSAWFWLRMLMVVAEVVLGVIAWRTGMFRRRQETGRPTCPETPRPWSPQGLHRPVIILSAHS